MPKREEGIDNIFHNLTITSTTVEVVLKEWMEAAGITKHITYHCSRHTCVNEYIVLLSLILYEGNVLVYFLKAILYLTDKFVFFCLVRSVKVDIV